MGGKEHDLVIIGGGAAGLTAGIYGQRSKLKTLLVEKLPIMGGQIVYSEKVENYPGFSEGISGIDLTALMEAQARGFGLEIKTGEVIGLKNDVEIKRVLCEGEEYLCRAVIIATGASPNRLGLAGEERFIGKGISFCGTCDGFFFKDLDVIVVGGGDTAIDEAIYLTRYAQKVYVVHRRNALRATKILQERALKNEKIEFIWDTVVDRIEGDSSVEKVVLKNVKTGATWEKPISGLFVFVGIKPNTKFLKGIVELDDQGFVVTNENLETSVPGIFAAGDVRKKLLRQLSTAVGDGATAAFAVEKYLENCFG
ncbi:MAG: thioredoxin-disulfide reductase [Thermodesulfobacteriota bacterium]|jgi:thioredoxin reductase (NADPH)|nr:MAG: thioredoxin-disulfide reductase [Thermodesulfobacteriota bacterium]